MSKLTQTGLLALMAFAFTLAGSAALATERTCYGKSAAPSIVGYYADNFGGYQLVLLHRGYDSLS